jgi:hypothetical protein
LIHRRRKQGLGDESRELPGIGPGGLNHGKGVAKSLDHAGHQEARGGLHHIGGRRIAAHHVDAAQNQKSGAATLDHRIVAGDCDVQLA